VVAMEGNTLTLKVYEGLSGEVYVDRSNATSSRRGHLRGV